MSSGYTKLFSDIVDSSIWNEDPGTCKVWVTLLALSNADGYVRGSIGWLAGKAKVTKEECSKAIAKFTEPDKHSRTPDNDGKRIEVLPDGWLILNYLIFRDRLSNDPKASATRERVRKHRERYIALRNAESVTCVTSDHSASASESVPVVESVRIKSFKKPELPELELYASKIGLPVTEISAFQDYYESNGWRVGKNPMKSWEASMRRWKLNCEQRKYENGKGHPPQRVDRSIGTANEGIADQYKGLGRVARP